MSKSVEPPLGVKILVVLAGVTGGLMIVAGSVFGAAFLDAFGPGFAAMGGLVAVVGLLYMAYAFGLWMLEPWAWWLAVILSGYSSP